jgi:hypothetical protein
MLPKNTPLTVYNPQTTPALPAKEGALVFTDHGRIFLGDKDGHWLPYDAFVPVPSMPVLEIMRSSGMLQTHRLYCVGNVLYRWDGMETHQVGYSIPSDEDAAIGSVLTKTQNGMEWKLPRHGGGIRWGGIASRPRWQ